MGDDWSWANSRDIKWRWILLEKDINPDDCILIYDQTSGPIVYAIWNVRYCRVEYLYAEIFDNKYDGEKSSNKPALAAVVRSRGNPRDHCGHLVGAQLGGRMKFYNLVPQDGYINSGFGHEACNYWSSIDSIIANALRAGSTFEIQYAPIYDDRISNTRPTQINVLLRETVGLNIRVTEYLAPNSRHMAVIMKTSGFKSLLSRIIDDWQSKQCKSNELKKFKRFDGDPDLDKEFDCFGETKKSTTQYESSSSKNHSKSTSSNQYVAKNTNHKSSNSKYNASSDSSSEDDSDSEDSDSEDPGSEDSSSKSTSWEIKRRPKTVRRIILENTPVVGSVVDFVDAAEDFKEGRRLQGSLNVVKGVTTLGLCLLGGAVLGNAKYLKVLK